jgi:hypothetical protein
MRERLFFLVATVYFINKYIVQKFENEPRHAPYYYYYYY